MRVLHCMFDFCGGIHFQVCRTFDISHVQVQSIDRWSSGSIPACSVWCPVIVIIFECETILYNSIKSIMQYANFYNVYGNFVLPDEDKIVFMYIGSHFSCPNFRFYFQDFIVGSFLHSET